MKVSTMTVLAGLLCSSAALAQQPVMMVQNLLEVEWKGTEGPFKGKGGKAVVDVVADFGKCDLYVMSADRNLDNISLTKPTVKQKGLKIQCNPLRIYVEYWNHDLILKEGQATLVRWSAYRDTIYSSNIRYWADTGMSEVRMVNKDSK